MSKAKPRFRTQYNYNENPTLGSKNTAESMTQPDMSLTARQLFMNHTRGHALGVMAKKGIYSETDIPYFEDIVDMKEYGEHLKEQQKILEKEIKEEVKKAQEAAKAAKEEKESPLSEKAKESLKENKKEPEQPKK